MATGTAVGSRGSIGAKLGGLVDTAVGRMELPVSYTGFRRGAGSWSVGSTGFSRKSGAGGSSFDFDGGCDGGYDGSDEEISFHKKRSSHSSPSKRGRGALGWVDSQSQLGKSGYKSSTKMALDVVRQTMLLDLTTKHKLKLRRKLRCERLSV